MSLFDIDQLRRNWEQVGPRTECLPSALATVRPPHDALKVSRELFERLRKLTELRFSSRMSAIRPFLDQASRALEELEHGGAPESASGPDGADGENVENIEAQVAVPSDPDALRSEILGVLLDLEDLFEALLGIGASTGAPPRR